MNKQLIEELISVLENTLKNGKFNTGPTGEEVYIIEFENDKFISLSSFLELSCSYLLSSTYLSKDEIKELLDCLFDLRYVENNK